MSNVVPLKTTTTTYKADTSDWLLYRVDCVLLAAVNARLFKNDFESFSRLIDVARGDLFEGCLVMCPPDLSDLIEGLNPALVVIDTMKMEKELEHPERANDE